jgi:hypothetical protein
MGRQKMGEVNAQIIVKEKNSEMGWAYTHCILDLGKGEKPIREDVRIVCAETSQTYMSREAAVEEAKGRVRVKIRKECGDIPESQIKWTVQSP